MRRLGWIVALAVAAPVSVLLPGSGANAVCNRLDKDACAPAVCSVFRREPCIPQICYPIGQDLRLTIESSERAEPVGIPSDHPASAHPITTLKDLFVVLRTCWIPPAPDDAWPGMQMSIRFAFKRTGEIVAAPRVTYAAADAPPKARQTYRGAINAALDRCLPLRFTDELGGAVAGRPIAIRFVDNRDRP